MLHTSVVILVAFVCSVIFCSVFEWILHRFVMHKAFLGFKYPFVRHALVHHRIFRADKSYHLQHEEHKHTIAMAKWNGVVLITIASIPSFVIAYLLREYAILATFASVCTAYYICYEYIHWCMHLPRDRFIERTGVFFRLNGHHLLHHRYMHKNFNVVLPLADLLLGTLVLRSRVSFPQASGPAVPNVQPKEPRKRLLQV
jgi:hypothetical protein